MKSTKRFIVGIVSGTMVFSFVPVMAQDAAAEDPVGELSESSQSLPREGSIEHAQQEQHKRFGEAAPDTRFRESDAQSNEQKKSVVTETDRVVVERDGSLAAEGNKAGSEAQQLVDDLAKAQVVRARALLGWDVVDAEGKKIGDITDFAVQLGSNEVPFVILTTGGVLGIGGKDRLVGLSSLSRNEEDGNLRLSEAEPMRDGVDGQNLVRFFSELEGKRTSATEGGELGIIEDMLINFDGEGAAYLIIDSRAADLTSSGRPTNYRVAVPVGVVEQPGKHATVSLTQDELAQLETADELDIADLKRNSNARIYWFNVDALDDANALQVSSVQSGK